MHSVEAPPSVVVGIDGSAAAVGAALWGVDEAIARDIPLRLVYAIDPREPVRRDADSFAHRFATAEIAVRSAFMAVEASQQAVKIEIEIVHEHPVATLMRASRSAAMMCLGAARHSRLKRLGSTASALSASAHCPVALLRGHDKVVRGGGGWIGVGLDRSSQNRVLVRRAMGEARLRRAPLRILIPRHLFDGPAADAAADSCIGPEPDLDFHSVPVRGSIADYLNDHAQSVKLFVVGADGLGQPDSAVQSVLYDTDCPLLILRGDPAQDRRP
ncbi:universal stress protein [Mycobacterium cookii]|uniref:Universal stress protein n=1 Tax=Mycobacterium cookii TaxID=1775 RepID=A0A7I7KWN9_9MYCO|nr:universal stress protein [Mycobacterium cookii]MCV7329990.1 universal stress protein [Mycobacterium cookii]BBX45918.1 universal stress protein [Mycobacterium cookii]